MSRCDLLFAAALGFPLLFPAVSHAQSGGFQLNRHDPTPIGTPFLAVESPRYNSERAWAAGFTLDYAHRPLRYGETPTGLSDLSSVRDIIEHQVISHFDFAIAFKDRILLSASLPVLLIERGGAQNGIAPISTLAVSDPRLSGWVRLLHQPHVDRWSLHLGVALWLPLRALGGSLPAHTSDDTPRVRIAAAASGVWKQIRYVGTFGLLYRHPDRLGQFLEPEGGESAPEVQLGLAAAYSFRKLNLTLGPELMFATSLLPSQALRRPYSSLEVLATAQHLVKKRVQLSLAVGLGFLSAPGTPDLRLLVRLAYAPLTRDRDQDGIEDQEDACPDQKGTRSDIPSNHGCPTIPDRDCDGVPDSEDECPTTPEGRTPDLQRIGCPRSGPRHESVFPQKADPATTELPRSN